MKKIFYIIIALLVLFSCTGRTIYKKPDDLIPKEQMVDLWVDIIIADGASNIKNKKAQRKINYMRFIYQKYQIDSTRFMRSNIYYTSKVEEYEKMFEDVSSKLKKIKENYAPSSENETEDEPEDSAPHLLQRDSIPKKYQLKKQGSQDEEIDK